MVLVRNRHKNNKNKEEKNNPTAIVLNTCVNPYEILSELKKVLGNKEEEDKQKTANESNKVCSWGNRIIEDKKNKYSFSNENAEVVAYYKRCPVELCFLQWRGVRVDHSDAHASLLRKIKLRSTMLD